MTRVGYCVDCGADILFSDDFPSARFMVVSRSGKLVPAGKCGCRSGSSLDDNMGQATVLSEIVNGLLNGKGGKQ